MSEAANGQQAPEAVERAMPSLVLPDLMMPALDGFGFPRARVHPGGTCR